jgi:hypothetical protein
MECWREGFELLCSRGSSAHVRGGREAVEVVPLCAEALGEVLGVPLLFEPVVNNDSACCLPMLETVGGPVQTGLVEGDFLVEAREHRSYVGFPPLLGVDLPLRPYPTSFRAAWRSRHRPQ